MKNPAMLNLQPEIMEWNSSCCGTYLEVEIISPLFMKIGWKGNKDGDILIMLHLFVWLIVVAEGLKPSGTELAKWPWNGNQHNDEGGYIVVKCFIERQFCFFGSGIAHRDEDYGN